VNKRDRAFNEGMNWNGIVRYPAAVNLLALFAFSRDNVSNARGSPDVLLRLSF
jgi:hypothetical protein